MESVRMRRTAACPVRFGTASPNMVARQLRLGAGFDVALRAGTSRSIRNLDYLTRGRHDAAAARTPHWRAHRGVRPFGEGRRAEPDGVVQGAGPLLRGVDVSGTGNPEAGHPIGRKRRQ